MDAEVFASLPEEMQLELIASAGGPSGPEDTLDPESGLDPETLAALPADMRREVIANEREERRRRASSAEAPADPSLAEDMDNASFLASLEPDVREVRSTPNSYPNHHHQPQALTLSFLFALASLAHRRFCSPPTSLSSRPCRSRSSPRRTCSASGLRAAVREPLPLPLLLRRRPRLRARLRLLRAPPAELRKLPGGGSVRRSS
jgi:hypothetical protein